MRSERHDLYLPEAMDDLQRFYDYYARRIENGCETDTPKVRLTLLGYGSSIAKTVKERPEEQWLPASQRNMRYYLDASSKHLVPTQPTVLGFVHEAHSLTDCSVSFLQISSSAGPH